MARYPTHDEYKTKPEKGIQRCDELLKKNPHDAQLLITKLQLFVTLDNQAAVKETLLQLQKAQPPIRRVEDLAAIEEVIIDSHRNIYPSPDTAGPDVAKLWDDAVSNLSNVNARLDILSLRMSRAIVDSRMLDAQQALIRLKALVPAQRVFYMAHAAFTQLLSTSKDDLHSKLALSLARKAVKEKFDDDKNLDCRVPGQIFALQSSKQDLKEIAGRRFADSKQVFTALRSEPVVKDLEAETAKPETTSPREWLLAEISTLQSQYKSLIASNSESEVAYEEFIANAVRLFTTATQDLSLNSWRPAAGPIFLAVSALVKLWSMNSQPQFLLRAAFLSEHLLSIQKDIYEARVTLVYIYARLGLGSLAMKEWDTLSIKEIQYDTIGHMFLTRLSTLHPHNFKDLRTRKLKAIEPTRLINHVLTVYRRHEEKLAETHTSILNHGQTGMIFDLHEVRESLRLSVTRRIISVEQRRIARFCNKKLDEETFFVYPQLTAAYLDSKDNRDFHATTELGYNVEEALHGHQQPRSWILYNLAADFVWSNATKQTPLINDNANLIDLLDKATQDSMTDAEYAVGRLVLLMLRLSHTGTKSDGPVSKLLEAIEELHINELITISRTLPLLSQDVYCYIDALRITKAFSKHAETAAVLSKEDATKLSAAAESAFKQIQEYSKLQSNRKDHASSIQSLLGSAVDEGAVWKSMASLKGDIRGFCDEIADSIKDSWLGVGQVKLG